MIEIRNKEKGLTIFVDNPNREGSFTFKYLVLDRSPNIIYKQYTSEFNHNKTDYVYKGIYSYIIDVVKAQAIKELDNYIAENIHRTEFYTKKDEYNHYTFFQYIHYKEPDFDNIQRYNIEYHKIYEGIVNMSINNIPFEYDLIEDKIVKIAEGITPLNIIFGYEINLNNIIARAQYQRGYANKTYTELMNICKFLDDKKSVKLVLKDGTVINSSTTSINQILTKRNDEKTYQINHCYDFKPRPRKNIDLSELDYFQYSKQKYKLNIDNLTIE